MKKIFRGDIEIIYNGWPPPKNDFKSLILEKWQGGYMHCDFGPSFIIHGDLEFARFYLNGNMVGYSHLNEIKERHFWRTDGAELSKDQFNSLLKNSGINYAYS